MAETSKHLGKMGLAMVEYFIEIKLGDDYGKRLPPPKEGQFSIKKAMQNTADRLWKDWADKRLWNAFFKQMPKRKELLTDLKQAVGKFYENPNDMDLTGVLTEILHENNILTPEAIQKAVEHYTTTLSEELLLVDKDFHEKVLKRFDLIRDDSLRGYEDNLTIQSPVPNQQTNDGASLSQVEKAAVQASGGVLPKKPLMEMPKPSLPKGSRFPDIFPDPMFMGREDSLKQLAAWLKDKSEVAISQVVGITGMSGVGKTQLACEFAHRYGRFFSGGVFWLSFARPDLIPIEVAACGRLAEISPLEIRVNQVLSDWESEIPRLLIFDDCEDPLVLAKWLPRGGGSRVLVTSRQGNWAPELNIQPLPMEPFPRSASIILLRGDVVDWEIDDSDLDAVASELEDNPLALQLAGSFLRTYRQSVKPVEYLNALLKPGAQKVRSLREVEFTSAGNELKIERTIAVSIDRLSQESEPNHLVLDLLRQIACFVPGEWIPRELLMKSAGVEQTDKDALGEGLNQLLGLCLVDENRAGDLRMHRLVARFIRDVLPDADSLARVENAVFSAAVAANQSGNPARMQPIIVHLKQFTDNLLKKNTRQAARLANELGYYLEVIGDYAVARLYFKQAVLINRNVLGEQHPDTTVSYNNLGGLLVKMGNYPAARSYYRQSLAIRRKVLGEEHPDTARSFNNLGNLTQIMGDYPAARSFYEQGLAIRRKLVGEEHPDTATSLYNLGGVMLKMGDYPSARWYYEKALEIRRKVLGEEHPDTATSLNDMGELMQEMGDQPGAQTYYEQALAIRRKTLGPEHPDTAVSLSKLGGLLQSMNNYPSARNYFEQSLMINRQVLGEFHPATIAGLNNLGNLLQAMGDEPDAQSYFEQVQTVNRKKREEKQPEPAARFNFKELPLRTKLALAAIVILSCAVVGWQVFARQNLSPTELNWFIATPSQESVHPSFWIFPQLGPKPTRVPSRTPTATRTRTPSPTNTVYSTSTPTHTLVPVVILPTATPIPSTSTIYFPTSIPPTNTFVTNPTVSFPTDTPVLGPTPRPTDTLGPGLPTDTPGPGLPTDTPGPGSPTDTPGFGPPTIAPTP
jgi:tetratricopeptide (TPR) repeat protein